MVYSNSIHATQEDAEAFGQAFKDAWGWGYGGRSRSGNVLMGNGNVKPAVTLAAINSGETDMILAILHFPLNRASWATRDVVLPKHDKTATPWVFTSPYSRIRKDADGFYILSYKKRVAVTMWGQIT